MTERIFKGVLITFLFLTYALQAQKPINVDSLTRVIEKNASLYADPHGLVRSFYSIEKSGISFFSSEEDKLNNKVECKIFWNEILLLRQLVKTLPNEALIKLYQGKGTTPFPDSLYQLPIGTIRFSEPSIKPTHPLKGLRIALDPGHVAGTMYSAAFELKYLKLKKDSLAGLLKPIELIEGNLTLATAFFLKKQLEEAGAEVMLTRNKPNHSSFGITYPEWLKQAQRKTFETAYYKGEITLEEKNRFIKKGTPKDIFQNYFRFADLYQRAKMINDYKPDLTIIIHYNVDEKNKPWTTPTQKNFNMVFVPGDLKPVFLKRIENRVELLRLLISEDVENSIELGKHLIKSFEKVLKVPTAMPNDASYLLDDCVSTRHTGVYVRNLALTRLVHGPVAYGETLYQDHVLECHLLANETLTIKGMKTSERVRQVAQAYFDGIMAYSLSLKK